MLIYIRGGLCVVVCQLGLWCFGVVWGVSMDRQATSVPNFRIFTVFTFNHTGVKFHPPARIGKLTSSSGE